jgi:hypothetical protein
MSFDMFAFAFKGGDLTQFDTAIVERVFGPLLAERDGDDWSLKLPEGPCFGAISVPVAPSTDSIAIDRPPLVPSFLNALYDFLKQTRTVLVWPGGGPHPSACVADAAVIGDLPEDLVESFGTPTVVSSGAEIGTCVSLSG